MAKKVEQEEWYLVSSDGKEIGPIKTDEMEILISESEVKPDDKVLKKGQVTWKKVRDTELDKFLPNDFRNDKAVNTSGKLIKILKLLSGVIVIGIIWLWNNYDSLFSKHSTLDASESNIDGSFVVGTYEKFFEVKQELYTVHIIHVLTIKKTGPGKYHYSLTSHNSIIGDAAMFFSNRDTTIEYSGLLNSDSVINNEWKFVGDIYDNCYIKIPERGWQSPPKYILVYCEDAKNIFTRKDSP